MVSELRRVRRERNRLIQRSADVWSALEGILDGDLGGDYISTLADALEGQANDLREAAKRLRVLSARMQKLADQAYDVTDGIAGRLYSTPGEGCNLNDGEVNEEIPEGSKRAREFLSDNRTKAFPR